MIKEKIDALCTQAWSAGYVDIKEFNLNESDAKELYAELTGNRCLSVFVSQYVNPVTGSLIKLNVFPDPDYKFEEWYDKKFKGKFAPTYRVQGMFENAISPVWTDALPFSTYMKWAFEAGRKVEREK